MAGPTLIDTGKPIDSRYDYAPGVVVQRAGLLFISGMVGWDADGVIVQDVEGQARQAFRNLGDVLHQAGLGFADIVMETEYVTDLSHYPVIGRERRKFFADNRPAATLVEVKGLFRPGLIFEIQAIAAL